MSSNLARTLGFIAIGLAMGLSILAGTPSLPKHRDPVLTRMVECGAEDGGPVLPCVWKHKDQDGNYLVYTK